MFSYIKTVWEKCHKYSHKNGGFSVGFRAKGAIITYILNLLYALLAILLLSVHHLLIRHYIFKDRVGRNVWNLVYGENLDLFLFGRQAIQLGERLLGGTEEVEDTMINLCFYCWYNHLFAGWVWTFNLNWNYII